MPDTLSHPEERERTATLCRMLGAQGSLGMFGHVSIRVAGTDRVCISPGAGSEKTRVRPEDVFVFDLDGTIVERPQHEIPIEWRIHTRIHRDRPEALSVLHLHGHYATLLGIADRALEPVFLHGAWLAGGVPTWDDPRLVTTDEMAADLARTLGTGRVVQMRGHGSVVAAESAEAAFFFATFLEQNARFQVEAAALGGARRLGDDVSRACAGGTLNARLFGHLWNYYANKVAL